MTTFEGGPVTCHVKLLFPWIDGTGFPYWPMTPPTINNHNAIKRAPQRRSGRRPHLSMNSKVGIVMTTLITYWILNTLDKFTFGRILRRWHQIFVSGQASHLEHVNDIVHHDVHPTLFISLISWHGVVQVVATFEQTFR